ncbi:MAG: hypothetical protein AB7G44_03510 [Bacteroidia bacterium]
MKRNQATQLYCTCCPDEQETCRHRFTCSRIVKAVITHKTTTEPEPAPKVKGFAHVPKQPLYPYK